MKKDYIQFLGSIAFIFLMIYSSQAQDDIVDYPFITDFNSLTSSDDLTGSGYLIEGTFVWTLNSGGTPTDFTGPSGDNSADASGGYLYTEASPVSEGDIGEFSTPLMDFSSLNAPSVSFFYHMYGLSMGTLEVDVLQEDGTLVNVLTITGDQQSSQDDPYLEAFVSLYQFADETVRLVFRGIRGSSFFSDIAIDDIVIQENPLIDEIGIADISLSSLESSADSKSFSIELINNGSADQTGFDVSYSLNGETVITETVSETLPAFGSLDYQFSESLDLSSTGSYTIEVNSLLDNDENTSNDVFTFDFEVLEAVISFPYAESFESGSGGWISGGSNSSWELATPESSAITGASDGTFAWITGNGSTYNASEQSYVMSPFLDFTGVENPIILLDIWYDIEEGWDGAALQFSQDHGSTWQNIGILDDPANWYNYNLVEDNFLGSNPLAFSGGNSDAWSGASAEYVTAIHALDDLGGLDEVLLRVVFGSDNAFNEDGISFDNIRISELADLLSLDCGDDIVVYTDAGENFATVEMVVSATNSFSDMTTITNTFNESGEDASGMYLFGDTPVTFTAVDDETGFEVSCSITVSVEDNELPVITGDSDITIISSESSVVVDYDLTATDNVGFPISYSQIGSQNVVDSNNSLVCETTSGIEADYGAIRIYDVPDDFVLTSVDFGVESSEPGEGFTTQTIYAKVYSFDPSLDVSLNNFTILDSASIEVGVLSNTILSIPLIVEAVAGEDLVIEIFQPDAVVSGLGHSFVMGSDTSEESGESYWYGSACDFTDIVATSTLADDVHWIIDINGVVKEGTPTLISGLGSGASFPQGTTEESYSITDFSGNETQVIFNVIVTEPVIDTEPLGLDELGDKLVIYPNPSEGLFTINLNSSLHVIGWELIDVLGKTIISEVNPIISDNQISVDATAFESGVYVLKVDTDEGSTLRRLIIQKK